MEVIRRLNQRTVILWSVLLSLSLVFAQGTTLHVHAIDHGHHYAHDHSHSGDHSADHSHISKAHSAHDDSHGHHHVGGSSEVNISPNGLLKAPYAKILLFAIITFILLLALPALIERVLRYHRDSNQCYFCCYYFSPPLRAPPL